MTEPAPHHLGFPRAMRLREGREFAQVREKGKRIVRGCLVANWTVLPNGSSPRLGVITARKLGKAHVRSRARRLLREAFRLHQHELRQPVAMVLVARSSIVRMKRPQVENDYLSVLRQATLLNCSQ